MAKRRVKKRTHVGAHGTGTPATPGAKPGSRAPKSMVIRVGASEVGSSVTQLVKDVRSMMEPDTASRLKERRSNKLRDYTTMAGPLGVTHLILFSKSTSGNINMRLALTPRGPTFHFRVEKYSLCKDIFQSMKRPHSGGSEYLVAPLLVMNNFTTQTQEPANGANEQHTSIPKHLESLATSVFQSLFPAINPTTTPLKGIKRVMLLDRTMAASLPPPSSNSPSSKPDDAARYVLDLRHYAIETRTAKSVPKALRRLDAAEKLTHAGQKRKRNAMPNLGRLTDVADYLLDPHAADGFTSGSDSEPETDAEVEVVEARARKVARRAKSAKDEAAPAAEPGAAAAATAPSARHEQRRVRVERKGIKLHELGPRMRLRLTKVEEGLCAGKVMWHEYIHKSKDEIREMDKVHEERRVERERRRAEQRANVERKKAEQKSRGKGGVNGSGDGDDQGNADAEDGDENVDAAWDDMDDDEWDSDGLEEADGDDGDDGDGLGNDAMEHE